MKDSIDEIEQSELLLDCSTNLHADGEASPANRGRSGSKCKANRAKDIARNVILSG